MNRILLLCCLLLPTVASAQRDTSRLRDVPNPRVATGSWVADPARHLSHETRRRLDSLITTLERETSAEILVAVLDSLDGLEAADAALTLHRRWGVGKRERDNGIVFLWSPAQRQVYISIGYGLEGVLPDARAGRIQDRELLPAFRRGDFDGGVLAAVTALASAARAETYSGPARATAGQERPGDGASRFPWVSLLVALAAIVGAVVLATTGRIPRRCPRGHGFMRRLSETADNAHLDEGQRVEEGIRSVDYDVWTCKRCDAVRVIPRRRWFSGYENCPECRRRTVRRTSRQVVAPSYSSEGSREVTLECRHCGFSRQYREAIPKLTRSSSSSGVAGSSGGGGGFSGGSSFGGGSAGGGGAGRGY